MIKHQQSIMFLLRLFTDVLMLSLAWVLSYYVRFYTFFSVEKGVPGELLYFKLVPFILAIWVFVFASVGLYQRSGKHRSAFVEALDILQACGFATIAFIAFTHFYEEYRYSRLLVILFAILHPVFLVIGRSLGRKILRLYARRSPKREVILVAGGHLVERAFEIGRFSTFGLNHIRACVLFGSDEEKKIAADFCQGQSLPTIENIGDTQEKWLELFRTHPCHTVIVAISGGTYSHFDPILQYISAQVTDIKLIPDIIRYTRFASNLELVKGTPVINIHDSPLAGTGAVVKRMVDLFGAAFGLIFLSPLLLMLTLAVKLSSKGPALYRQPRLGLDGQVFDILKFRSMPLNAESQTGAVWANKNDNRPTSIGKFMRRTSLDELPQLLNVLRGEMSLVGPRPERPVFVDQFRTQIPDYMLRHKVKAGMTGWAQVCGWRGSTSIEKRIECDLYYIQNWSFWFDVRIILLTFIRGFINKNAY
ncbi:MAG: undecaprenyl-phosphate glucose phosphotransferase [Oligoflexales bacterium]|nr:undecaprenyl-phosphate glucose phosphotransferase [Oligoflexales bacterium]